MLSLSTLCARLQVEGRLEKVRKRSSGSFKAPFRIAMEVTFSGSTELIGSVLVVASKTGT